MAQRIQEVTCEKVPSITHLDVKRVNNILLTENNHAGIWGSLLSCKLMRTGKQCSMLCLVNVDKADIFCILTEAPGSPGSPGGPVKP